jgi:hypothetical protein
MRVLVKVRCAEEMGDAPRENRTLLRRTRECLRCLEVEAVYYGFHNDRKAAYLVLNVLSLDRLPASVEPLCVEWNAGVDFAPAKIATGPVSEGIGCG